MCSQANDSSADLSWPHMQTGSRNPPKPEVVIIGVRDYVMDIFHQEKIGVNPLRGFFSPYTRNIHPMFAMLRMFTTFLVLPLAYSRDACMDFNA